MEYERSKELDSEPKSLATFLAEECEARLRAYTAQPRDAAEHFETENDVLSGGYAYRQLFELVQNAADAILEEGHGSGRIHVCLERGLLTTANTGAPLDEGGIIALLNARSSSKRGGQIGRFGVGFKSLLKLGGQVDIVSRTIGLRFEPDECRRRIRAHLNLPADARAPGMRLATSIDPRATDGPLCPTGTFHWATTVVTAVIADPIAYDRLVEEMAAFPAEFVLFLAAEIDLTLEVIGGSIRQITKHLADDVVIVSDGDAESRWRLFQGAARIEDRAAKEDATHIQARDEVPIAWAVPLSVREQAGRFWAFFPTETQSLTSGILNAPWKLNSDRTNLIRGPWNTELMKAAASLVATCMPKLSTKADPGAPVSALPRQLERQDELAAPLIADLWSRLADAEIVPDACGILRRPGDLRRHAVPQQDAAIQWSNLASEEVRSLYVHPSVYANANRTSRLNTLAGEAVKKGRPAALSQSSVCSWLEALPLKDGESGARVLHFLRELVEVRRWIHSYMIGQPSIIPTAGGAFCAPNRVMLTPATSTPAGFEAVAAEIAADPVLRTFLTDVLSVSELDDEQWESVLSSCEIAAASDPNAWQDFWANFATAPPAAIQDFLEYHPVGDLLFRNRAGGWTHRGSLLGPTKGTVADHLSLDVDYHAPHRDRLPSGWLDEFPPLESEALGEAGDLGYDEIAAYLKRVEQAGWMKIPSGPQYAKLGVLGRHQIEMPSGWRLLSPASPGTAARLTERLVKSFQDGSFELDPVIYGHKTRRDQYPTYTAPDPILFWLHQHGRVSIGKYVFRLRVIEEDLANYLVALGFEALKVVLSFYALFSTPTDLRGSISWASDRLDDKSRALLWEQVAGYLEVARTGFQLMRPIWEKAASDGFVPKLVPTIEGPQPIDSVYVTSDAAKLAHLEDDGSVVVLSRQACEEWIQAGAHALEGNVVVQFADQLGSPTAITDMFPELAGALDAAQAQGEIRAAWVRGLEEQSGPRKIHPAVARDMSGLVLIDRGAFERLGWLEGIATLIRALVGWGLLSGDVDQLLSRATDIRVSQARRRVREASSMSERLMLAVGGSVAVLLDTLSPATRQAVAKDLDALEAAELALAVHGPTILGRVSGTLAAEGLDPPTRWGGEAARIFVLETGFPLEFASSARVKREGEFSVSGPIVLPPLHDYQNEILDSLGVMFEASAGRRRAVISLPTGGGKTRVAAEAVVRLVLNNTGTGKRSALWIAQTDELCEQAVQCFRQLWVNIGTQGEELRVIRLWGGQSALPIAPEADEAVVVIASIQTINNRFDVSQLDWLSSPAIVVIDECHHAITKSYSSLLRWLDVQTGNEAARDAEPPVLGLSATPWRGHDEDESARLAARFDKRWLPSDQHALYDRLRGMGVLAKLEYRPINYSKPVSLSAADVRHFEQYGELPEPVIERMATDSDRNDLIIDAIIAAKSQSVLLFANSVAHAQYLAARLHLEGCPAAAVSGETDRLARQHFIRRFRSGEIRVLCNHSVLTTGFDAPRADMILISRPVFSPVRYMQMVGRGLRGVANGGTESCSIVTVEDNILVYRDRLAYHYCRRFFDA